MKTSIALASACIFGIALLTAGCSASAKSEFFGKTDPPRDNILRYVSGSEPESLDPQQGSGQPEARIYMALYEGLTEYDPKTMLPLPALANADEAFLTSSTRDVQAISSVDGSPLSASPGPLTKAAADAFRELQERDADP